jgi:predicted tellurium resistance membrane protein TerC
MDAFFTSSALLALITLTFLEIVLGVDNVIFFRFCRANFRRRGKADLDAN